MSESESESESGADPGLLVLEITETAVNADENSVLDFVERIHSLGCKVALDDFAQGHHLGRPLPF